MSVKKDGKTYTAIISYKENGKYRRKVKRGFSKKSEALIFEAQWITKLSEGYLPSETETLFVDYYDEWLESHIKSGIKTQTIVNHEWTQRYVHEKLSGITLNKLTKPVFQKFIDEYGETHRASSTKQLYLRVSMPLKEAFNSGIIKSDPTYKIRITGSKSKNSDLKFLEEEDLNKLLTYIENEDPVILSHFVIYTLALSGMRAGESLALTFNDIDEINKTISINKNKTNRTPHEYTSPKSQSSIRTITMPDRWFKQFNKFKKIMPINEFDEHFFGESTDQSNILRRLKKILLEINAKEISLHGLRHTHASFLINHGVDIAYVSERLGHSNVSITQKTYFHLLKTNRDKSSEQSLNLFENI